MSSCQELEIPVPWGKVSGQIWGKIDSSNKLLLVHGILHNSAAFNQLVPYLPSNYHIVSIDLPGHGLSSYFPQGLPINFLNYVYTIKKVIDYLQWDDGISCIAHSFGGQICTHFAALFANHVKKLIVIDTMEPIPAYVSETSSLLQQKMCLHLELEKKLTSCDAKIPVYSREEIFARIKKNNKWPLSDEAANDLMGRGIKPYENGFTFAHDQRLKVKCRPILTLEQLKQIMDNLNCPVLFILTTQNMERYSTYLKDIYSYNTSKENCQIVQVEGDHAVHQNHPDRISDIIINFLNNE